MAQRQRKSREIRDDADIRIQEARCCDICDHFLYHLNKPIEGTYFGDDKTGYNVTHCLPDPDHRPQGEEITRIGKTLDEATIDLTNRLTARLVTLQTPLPKPTEKDKVQLAYLNSIFVPKQVGEE